MSDWKTRVDLDPAQFDMADFPPREDWLLEVKYVGGHSMVGNYHDADANGDPEPGYIHARHVSKDGDKTVMVHQICYRVQGVSGVRTRRCFVAHTYVDVNIKPILLAAFSGSSPPGYDGTRDLFYTPPGGADIQFSWPLEVVRDNGIFAVLIDQPRYGPNSYTPTNAYDGLIDAVSGIDAARWFVNNTPIYRAWASASTLRLPLLPNLLVGGLSYGAITSSFLAGALKDVEAAYMAGAYPVKATQGCSAPPYEPEWYPADWVASGYDYTDMLKASTVKKAIITYGQNDYARVNASWPTSLIDNACNGLVSYDPTRFEYLVRTTTPVVQGHEIDLPHIRQWFTERVNALTTGDRALSSPPL